MNFNTSNHEPIVKTNEEKETKKVDTMGKKLVEGSSILDSISFDKLYINGEYVESDSKEFITVENPATCEVLAKVPRGNKNDVDRAVKAAKVAFESFKKTTLEERIEIIEKFNKYLKENTDEIAEVIMKELGSPRHFAKSTHVEGQIKRVERYIEIVKEYEFERKEENTLIRKEPLGVVACITPWNYPLGQIIQKIIFAILTGNTVVLKPSQNTPLVAYYVVDGLKEAGLPAGVLNLVTGVGGEVGDAMATHPDVDMVSFTGSTAGGIEVSTLAQETVKKVALELGGKSPVIFLDETKIAEGVKRMLGTIANNTGQTCSAWTRAIVLNNLKDQFQEEVKKQLPDFVVGDPTNDTSKVGPLSSKKQYDKVTGFIEKGKEKYDVLFESNGELPQSGYFVNPIVFDDVDNSDELAQEEIFGPVLCVIYANSVEEAIELANDTKYGLAGAVFGEKDKAFEVAKEIRSGTVFVNDSSGDVGTPFGGYKMSGVGREGGVEGLEEYIQTKTMPMDFS